MPQCDIGGCDFNAESLKGLKRHYNDQHSGEIETPNEYLGGTDSEQRDFEGEEPDESDHNPEYETRNDPDSGEKARLTEWEQQEESDDE